MILDLQYIGKKCKEYRKTQGYRQTDVSNETHYSSENVSSFETGRNDNARILLWYFTHGMTMEFLNEGVYQNEV